VIHVHVVIIKKFHTFFELVKCSRAILMSVALCHSDSFGYHIDFMQGRVAVKCQLAGERRRRQARRRSAQPWNKKMDVLAAAECNERSHGRSQLHLLRDEVIQASSSENSSLIYRFSRYHRGINAFFFE
jgi:hypothetical protein